MESWQSNGKILQYKSASLCIGWHCDVQQTGCQQNAAKQSFATQACGISECNTILLQQDQTSSEERNQSDEVKMISSNNFSLSRAQEQRGFRNEWPAEIQKESCQQHALKPKKCCTSVWDVSALEIALPETLHALNWNLSGARTLPCFCTDLNPLHHTNRMLRRHLLETQPAECAKAKHESQYTYLGTYVKTASMPYLAALQKEV